MKNKSKNINKIVSVERFINAIATIQWFFTDFFNLFMMEVVII